MGSMFKKASPKIDLQKSDYKQAVEDRTRASRDASLNLLKRLEQQTGGQGASLANLQTKAASNKNLSELLAASAAQRGTSPVSNAGLMQASARAGQQLATGAGQARAKEIQALQGQRGSLGIGQQQQDLIQVMAPGKLLAQAEIQRYLGDVEKQRRIANEQMMLMTGGASGLAQGMGAGGMFGKASGGTPGAAYGGHVSGSIPGAKDDPSYDTIDITVSPEEIILPRSVTKAKNAPEKAKKFVEALMKQKPKHKTNFATGGMATISNDAGGLGGASNEDIEAILRKMRGEDKDDEGQKNLAKAINSGQNFIDQNAYSSAGNQSNFQGTMQSALANAAAPQVMGIAPASAPQGLMDDAAAMQAQRMQAAQALFGAGPAQDSREQQLKMMFAARNGAK